MDANEKMAAQVLSPICSAIEADEYLDFEVITPLNNYNASTLKYAVDRLAAGCSILIEGTVKENCSSFYVNLRCGEDIALHINPRFDQKYIARNAKINRIWGQEESQLLQAIPFKRGQHFILEILVAPSEYMVSVNGVHMFSFSHRLTYSDVKSVEISSDAAVSKFILAQTTFYPSSPIVPVELPVKKDTTCPVIARLGPLQVGDLIEVTGRVHSLPHSFYINLQGGVHSIPHPIIAYHFVARYMPVWQIAQNSWSSGRWNEEFSEKLPAVLLPGENFRLIISCLRNGFSANISGKILKVLPNRVPISTVNVILIQNVKLNK